MAIMDDARASECAACFLGLSRFLGFGAGKSIIVIVGPSGVGKTTLIKQLMNEFPGRFGFSVSHTTRQPRPGETHGVHYNFTSHEKMREAIDAGAFIEHAEVHGNLYGTSVEAVQTVVSSDRICLLDIDVQGAIQVKKSALNPTSAFMFLAPPSLAALEERLRGRGTECEEKVLLRLENARQELMFAEEQPKFFEQVLVNDDLVKAYKKFRSFMERECGRRRLAAEENVQSSGCPSLFASMSSPLMKPTQALTTR